MRNHRFPLRFLYRRQIHIVVYLGRMHEILFRNRFPLFQHVIRYVRIVHIRNKPVVLGVKFVKLFLVRGKPLQKLRHLIDAVQRQVMVLQVRIVAANRLQPHIMRILYGHAVSRCRMRQHPSHRRVYRFRIHIQRFPRIFAIGEQRICTKLGVGIESVDNTQNIAR